jgi:hypothetical protein
LSGFITRTGKVYMANTPKGSNARACMWYTNLKFDYSRRNIILTESYIKGKYQKYYNFNGINVDKVKNIPYDFRGVMGVPITYLRKFNPYQFELLGTGVQAKKTRRWPGDKAMLWTEKNGKPDKAPFERILIRNKKL